MRKHRFLGIVLLAGGASVLGTALAASGASEPAARPPQGGIFKVVFAQPEPLDTMDPAIANTDRKSTR